MEKGKILKTGATFSIGIAIVAILVRQIGFDEALDAFKQANTTYVLAGVAASLISILLAGERWRLIINNKELKIPNRPLYISLLSGNFVNNITPAGKGGGEPLRAYLLSKMTGMDSGKAFATVISDRIFDTLPYVLLGYFGLLNIMFFWEVPRTVLISLLLAILLLTALVGVILYMLYNINMGKRVLDSILSFFSRFFPEKIKKFEAEIDDKLMLFNSTIREISHDRKKLVFSTIISMAIWGFWILRTYVIFVALDVTVSFTVLAVVAVVSSFMGMLPFSPGGFGTTEGAMIIMFSGFGIEPHIAVAATLIDRFISYWLLNVMGAFSLGLSRREMGREKYLVAK